MKSLEAVAGADVQPPSLHCRAKRSWFANFRLEREKEEVVVVCRDKSFQELKASLLQAFTVSGSAPAGALP